MNLQNLDNLLRDVVWWQIWEIAPGVFTPGKNDVRRVLDMVELPDSLAGKRVLDIGGWNGCFSFECERRGAAEVVMIEPTPIEATGFDKIRQFLGSKVRFVSGTIYDLDPKWLGHFDIVLCLGVIYHLRYPLLGLDNIRRVCRGDLYVESAILDETTWTPAGGIQPLRAVSPEIVDLPFMEFFAHSEFFNDGTNWFVPNACAVNAMLDSAGFDVIRHKCDGRYYGCSRLKPGEAPMLHISHEGISYEAHGRALLGDKNLWPLIR